MTDKHKAIMALIQHYTAKATVDRETALRTLVEEGIYNEDGTLTAEYGGDSDGDIELIIKHLRDLDARITELEGGGWITWNGGVCPVAHNTRVSMRFRSGQIAESSALKRADGWRWGHFNESSDIVAYKVIK